MEITLSLKDEDAKAYLALTTNDNNVNLYADEALKNAINQALKRDIFEKIATARLQAFAQQQKEALIGWVNEQLKECKE